MAEAAERIGEGLPAEIALAGDLALASRAAAREPQAVRQLMNRHNRRLYRIARSILRDDGEAEEALQEAWLRAFGALGTFRGESSLSTWLSRIVINEALGRLRKRRRAALAPWLGERGQGARIIPFPGNPAQDDPERTMAQRQILELVERATDALPDLYRTVFVARAIEGLSLEETAELLSIKPETVKTRLHRARKLVRRHVYEEIGPVLLDAFPFAGPRCALMTERVMRLLGIS